MHEGMTRQYADNANKGSGVSSFADIPQHTEQAVGTILY